MTSPERQLELVHFLDALSAQLARTEHVEKMVKYALRVSREFLHARSGCVFLVPAARSAAEILTAIPDDEPWSLEPLIDAHPGGSRPAPPGFLLAALPRHGLAWGMIALAGVDHDLEGGRRRELSRIASAVSSAIDRSDLNRMRAVQDRIERKTLQQLPAKDLYYHVLDGLRSLTRYDHSSALLLHDERSDSLVLAAEQISWTKGKSRHINLRLPVAREIRELLHSGVVYGFDRLDQGWQEWEARPVAGLAELLDFNRDEPRADDEPRENSMLCAPLSTREGVLGILKLAARSAGNLRPHDAFLIERFRLQAAVAIQNVRKTETLRTRMIEAERRNAMVALARGVSHDVNNALGAVLPLVQQLQEDLRAGTLDPQTLAGDLEQLHTSVAVVRRIFSGMLSFARRAERGRLETDVGRALEGVLAILRDGLERREVVISCEVAEDLPLVGGDQGQVEQLFLNLLTNARDAMREGGRLTIRARSADGKVDVSVEDTGEGIPPENLAKIQEPFFSTRQNGTGLGLSICRAILWEMGGEMKIHSGPAGTKVQLLLPAARRLNRAEPE